uniref:Odorant receptor n=1 Tax=Trichogramma kaykai TaxID=54128 RepID=A0ABD2XAG4_9HYME
MNRKSIDLSLNEAGYEYAIGYTRNLFLPFGIWPVRDYDESRGASRARATANFLCLFVLFFVVGPYFVQTFLIEKDNQVRIKSTGACVFGITNVAKYLVFLLRGRRIGSCLAEMRLDWRSIADDPQRRLMLRNARAARLLTCCSFVFMFGGGVPYVTVLPLSQPPLLLADNRTLLRHLTYPSYFGFFEPRVRPVYDLVFSVHFCFGILAFSLTTGLCSFIATCTLHVASRCAFVSAMYRELGRNFDRELLSRVVVQHRRIIA